MPNYRTGNDEYRRKPKMSYEPEAYDEDEDMEEEPVKEHKPCPKKHFCRVECPFKIIVKVVPCDEHKECKECEDD